MAPIKSLEEEANDLGNIIVEAIFKEFHGKASVREANLRLGFVKLTDPELIISEYADVVRLLFDDPDMEGAALYKAAEKSSFYIDIQESLLVAWNPPPRKRVYLSGDGISLISLPSKHELVWQPVSDF